MLILMTRILLKTITVKIDDTDEKVMLNDLLDIDEWVQLAVTGKINNIKPNAPQVVGQTKQPKLEKTFSEMSDVEKSSNWQSILKAYKK